MKISLRKLRECIEIFGLKTKLLSDDELIFFTKQYLSPKNTLLEFINLIDQLSILMKKKGEQFRAKAYQKAKEALSIIAIDNPKISPEEIRKIHGIGKSIADKYKEFITTGKIDILEQENRNPILELSGVYGIGPKKADELIKKGIKSIKDLRKKENINLLNDIQKIGLKYYDDIQLRIPREEINLYLDFFNDIFKKIKLPDSKLEIVGSYRRGLKDSGDIDVIVSNLDFKKFIDDLLKTGLIIEILSRGPSKCLIIGKLDEKPARRIDFLNTSIEEYPFALLYFTGSKIFNTVMRGYAKDLGYSINEHRIIDGKTGEKLKEKFATEKDIFDFLHLQYKNPNERIDGSSVILQK